MKTLILFILLLGLQKSQAQWQQLSLGAAYADFKVNDLYFINDSVGFAACWVDEGLGGIFKTVDGGFNWTPTIYSGYSLQEVEFVSLDTGYAVGNNGRIYRTFDQGGTWEVLQTITTTVDLRSIHFVTHQKAFIGSSVNWCSGCPILLMTEDAWQTYSPIVTPDSGILAAGNQIVCINFYDVDTGFAIAETGNLFRTVDGGDTWLYNYDLGNSYTSFEWLFFNPQKTKTFLVGRANVNATNQGASIYYSYNVGIDWTEIPFTNAFGIDTLTYAKNGQFVTEDIGYIVGGPKAWTATDGGIMKTVDGGETWIDDPVEGNNAIYFLSIHCPSPSVCYILGYNGVIMKNVNADSVETSVGN